MDFNIVFIFLTLNFFSLFNIEILKNFGNIMIILFFIYNILLFIYLKKISKNLKKYIWIIVAIVILYLLNLRKVSLYNIQNIFKIIFLSIYTLNLSNLKGNIFIYNKKMKIIISLIILFQYFIYFIGYEDLYRENVMSGYNIGLLFFLMILNDKKFLLVNGSLIIIINILGGSRSSLIAIFVIFITYYFWDYINQNKKIYYIYLIGIFLLILGFMYIYIYGEDIYFFNKLNDLSLEFFEKRLYSGRNRMWKTIIERLKDNIFYGKGTGTIARDIFFEKEWSAHNLYVQILIEVGVIGLILWGMFYFIVWGYYYKLKGNSTVRICASYMVGFIVSNVFELTFYSNQLAIGIIQWTSIGIGLNIINKDKKGKK